jgi:hypothetical protein
VPETPKIQLRLTEGERAFLLELEEFNAPGKRSGIGPAVHRLIEVAREWDSNGLSGRLRAYLRAEGVTVEEFASLANMRPQTVRDILSLRTRKHDVTTVAKVRSVIGSGD